MPTETHPSACASFILAVIARLVSCILVISPSLSPRSIHTPHLSVSHCSPYAGLTSPESDISQAGWELLISHHVKLLLVSQNQ